VRSRHQPENRQVPGTRDPAVDPRARRRDLRVADYSPFRRGSSRSRRASPVRLKASTAAMMASPENVVSHGQHLMYWRASLRMLPQLGVGGGMPSPRKDRLASVRMAVAMYRVPTTTSAYRALGNTWRAITRSCPLPRARAAMM